MLKKAISLFLSAAACTCLLGTPATAYAADNNQQIVFSSLDPNFNGGEPIRGADISSIVSLEKSGVKFYNENGREDDLFRILAEKGVNYIRVRVWNEPWDSNGNTYGGGNNDLYTAAEIGKRAAQYNMKLLVDIQYSDFWADPAKQTRPKYWQNHDHEKLKSEIYKYTKWVLETISEAGADIGMVQVGNETNCFFCGEKDMYKICDLFASGNKAVRDFDKNILIAHHFANPSKTDHYEWYAEIMDKCGLDYDVFATSYYPYWHGSTQNLTYIMKKIADRYNKYVMVAETAYPYTSEDGDEFGNTVVPRYSDLDFAYDISVEGQADSFRDTFKAISNVGPKGIGVFYWEPAWIGVENISYNERVKKWDEFGSGWATKFASEYDHEVNATGGSSFDNQALFDKSGRPLKSLDVFTEIYPRKENFIPPTEPVLPPPTYDLNGDGYVNVFDIVVLRQIIASKHQDKRADYNSDGEIGVADLVMMYDFLICK